MTQELKPCPFCGCEAEIKEDWGNWRVWGFHAKGCFFHCRESSAYASRDYAITAWNTRTTLQTEGEKKLREALGELVGQIEQAREGFGTYHNSESMGKAVEAARADLGGQQ